MAFCPNCGTQVTGNFCPSCGTGVAATAGMQDNVASGLCYLLGLITGVLFLVLEPYNKRREVRFHAFQSIFLSVGSILILFALTIVGAVAGHIVPIFGALLVGGLSFVLWLGSLALWIMLMVKTFNGYKLVLPVIGPLAQKQAG